MPMAMAVGCVTDSRWSMSSLMSALPSSSSTSYSLSPTTTLRFPSSSSRALSLSRRQPTLRLRSFSGLSPFNPLLSLGFSDDFVRFPSIDNGSRFFAMRHGRRVPKLNRPPDQRKALLRGLTTQLLKHGRIKTTRARASAMRKYVDKMITLAKDGSLHKRRQALGFIYEKQIVHALFAEVPDRYGERNGGYTRIIRTLPRRGDNAPMAYIELV
ncbi:hypothetical protein JCGZ_00605 [Jatropha curcas]|uniref:Large ribosomal subunit protein bL17c n=1 Tax=Jatropha curcas TaxID=180498 RepID=A0A067JGB4_JATCU|nr:50S ribosomal protein L17, chloroplastic [Jatropha curcas]KDP21818.1 hypothetical protein JCGZ_00605 [Jatropha curcas]